MAFDLGARGARTGPRRVRPSMNVTPLVDVVLVLLIIFMVITPLLSKQFSTNVPVKEGPVPPPADPDAPPPVVLAVRSTGHLEINRERVEEGALEARLQRVMAAQPGGILFFTADDDVPHGRALEVMDRARGGGARIVAVMTESPTED